MANPPSKSPQAWLHHHSEHLDALLGQVRVLSRITGILRDILPQPLAAHCLAANVDGDTLVVGCDSSAWAAKLRYQIPQLLGALQAQPNLPALSQIRIRVQPLQEERPRTVNRRLTMSAHSAALITSVADNIADPGLKAALRRLGRRAKSSKKP